MTTYVYTRILCLVLDPDGAAQRGTGGSGRRSRGRRLRLSRGLGVSSLGLAGVVGVAGSVLHDTDERLADILAVLLLAVLEDGTKLSRVASGCYKNLVSLHRVSHWSPQH
jgi:hypothetical protein